jgi:hypothetical protein
MDQPRISGLRSTYTLRSINIREELVASMIWLDVTITKIAA